MDRNSAIDEIRSRWRDFYHADSKRGIICPLCGSGSGSKGSGITENPSSKGSLKCWACDFQGDILDLIQKEKGYSFPEALKYAADSLGITIDEYKGDNVNTSQKRSEATRSDFNASNDKIYHEKTKGEEKAFKELVNYVEYYRECAKRLSDAAPYLAARGISIDTAMLFDLGYDPEWISPTIIAKQKAKGSSWIPDATSRLIIPVTKNFYIARATDSSVNEYAKCNETGGGNVELFNAEALYYDSETVFVTEGVFDALSVIEVGAAAIALNSTSNAKKLIEMLEKERTSSTLVLCLDSDTAGERARKVLVEGLQRLNISYIDANINCGHKDPNEALVADKEKFKAAVEHAVTYDSAKPDSSLEYLTTSFDAEIERFCSAGEKKTGFTGLDKESNGLYSGLYVLAAISSLGKTTFCLQMADQLAAAGNDVLFFSLEQSRLELVSKSLARITAQIDKNNAASSLQIRKGFKNANVNAAIERYKSTSAKNISIIEGNFNCDVSFIGDYIRKYVKQNNARPIVFIDYLQILQSAADKHLSTKETVDMTVTELKRLSRELDLTIIVISSVNRSNYLTPIDFESMKESGGIEYTADVIWGLQFSCLNEEIFSSDKKIKEKRDRIKEAKAEDPRKIQLVCLKNRYGKMFDCSFSYYPKHDLYEDLDGFTHTANSFEQQAAKKRF